MLIVYARDQLAHTVGANDATYNVAHLAGWWGNIWQGGGGIRISVMLPDEIIEGAQLVVREELPDGTLRFLEPLFNTGIENRGRYLLFQSSFCHLDEPKLWPLDGCTVGP
jgi:hypothetical protein